MACPLLVVPTVIGFPSTLITLPSTLRVAFIDIVTRVWSLYRKTHIYTDTPLYMDNLLSGWDGPLR